MPMAGRIPTDKDGKWYGTVHLEHTGSHGVSHPAGTDHEALRDAAMGEARKHLENMSPLVNPVHHGKPHNNSKFSMMRQGKDVLDLCAQNIENARNNPPAPEDTGSLADSVVPNVVAEGELG